MILLKCELAFDQAFQPKFINIQGNTVLFKESINVVVVKNIEFLIKIVSKP